MNIFKKSKYNNKKISLNGYLFDSKKEAYRYQTLLQLQNANIISNLQIKYPVYVLINKNDKYREIKYIPDFTYNDESGYIVEDVKGFRTPEYILKKKMMYSKYKIDIKEI